MFREPRNWFGEIEGKKILCLASGGGQQGPILAAAGANVTVFDNSFEQLKRDEYVAKRDYKQLEKGIFNVKHAIPYSEIKSLTEEERTEYIHKKIPFEFGHTLEDQIKGQIDAGFVIAGFFEDNYGGRSPLDQYINTFMATCAIKVKID